LRTLAGRLLRLHCKRADREKGDAEENNGPGSFHLK
jgi:hypothetical protein